MTDQRFESRLKRIDKRSRGRPQAEMLAGVGEVSKAKRLADTRGFPFITMLYGLVAGAGIIYVLNERLGLDGAIALTRAPEDVVPLAQADMVLGGAMAGLAVLSVLFIYAACVGRAALKTHVFAFMGLAAACGGAAYYLADMDAIMALAQPYLNMVL